MKRITAKAFYDHIEADSEAFRAIHKRMDELATKKDVTALSNSVQELLEAFKTAKYGFSFLKLSGRSIILIGGVIGALVTILGGWKIIIGYFTFRV